MDHHRLNSIVWFWVKHWAPAYTLNLKFKAYLKKNASHFSWLFPSWCTYTIKWISETYKAYNENITHIWKQSGCLRWRLELIIFNLINVTKTPEIEDVSLLQISITFLSHNTMLCNALHPTFLLCLLWKGFEGVFLRLYFRDSLLRDPNSLKVCYLSFFP